MCQFANKGKPACCAFIMQFQMIRIAIGIERFIPKLDFSNKKSFLPKAFRNNFREIAQKNLLQNTIKLY